MPGPREILNTLSAQERAWLNDHPVIRVVQDPGWPPVEFIDEHGEPSGMAADYLNLVQQQLGVKFQWVRGLSWQEAYARLKRGEIDMTTSVAVTPERNEFWAFTKPYMTIPIVIATHPDVTYIASMRELAGKRVAVVDGYAVNDWIPRDFPEIRLVRVKTAQEGLEALQRGDVFAYIDNLLIIGHYQAKLKVANIKIAGQTPYVNAQAMAVRKDWGILAGILQKALDSISETERNDIYRRWLPIRFEQGVDHTLLWQALAAFAVVLLALVVWNRRLSREIAHRKRAETAWGDAEARYRLLVDQSPDGIVIIDPATARLLEFNETAHRQLGYSREEFARLSISDFEADESPQETRAHIAKVVRDGRSDFETRHRTRQGELRNVHVTAQSTELLGRSVYHCVWRDITARRQAEAALASRTRELEAVRRVGEELTRELDLSRLLGLIGTHTAALMGSSGAMVWLWSDSEQALTPAVHHGIGEWVRAERLALGEGVVGTVAARREGMIVNDYQRSPLRVTRWAAIRPVQAVMAEPLLYREQFLGVINVDHLEANRSFQEADRYPLQLFAAQAATAIENARLHEAAVRRGAELETLLAATRSVMSGLELQEILDRIVAEAHRISGVPHVKILLLDRSAGLLRVGAVRGMARVPGETLPLDRGLSAHVIRSGEPLYIAQCAEDPRNLKGERDRALGLQAYLGLPISRGTEILGVLTFNTTTPKNFSPAELAYLTSFAGQAAIAIENARLYTELHDSYARLQAAQGELVRTEKLRGLGQMAAGIAHDLNNTLAAILGQVELVKLRGVPPDIQESLHTLETAAADGAQVVRRLQDFARQRASLPLVSLALPPVVQEALGITGPRWKDEVQRRGQTIQVRVDLEALPPILGHAPEIREALTNVIFNAVDAMPEGGVLTVTGTTTPGGVCLHVADTGVGMPETVRQKIFEPFFTTKGVKGTGLGLSVVYGIMERHGGRVLVASRPGEGTTISLQFQAASAAPREAAPDRPPDPRPARRILLIDDEPVVRRTMAELLRAAGQTVHVAESGPAGLAQLAAALPDIVLTDLGMPEMSGVELARRVKAAHPRLPVVLLTGWGDTAMLSADDRAAVDRVLGKPARMAEVLRVVAELTGPADTATSQPG
jgi:PAS domain S-box-containing protein